MVQYGAERLLAPYNRVGLARHVASGYAIPELGAMQVPSDMYTSVTRRDPQRDDIMSVIMSLIVVLKLDRFPTTPDEVPSREEDVTNAWRGVLICNSILPACSISSAHGYLTFVCHQGVLLEASPV